MQAPFQSTKAPISLSFQGSESNTPAKITRMELPPCKTELPAQSWHRYRAMSPRDLRCYCYIGLVSPEADPILSAFYDTGAYLRGHFRLTSGLHSPEYLQCALVLQHPRHAEHFGRLMAAEFRRLEPTLDTAVVVSPAIGGLIIGHEVARALGARFIFTERDASGKMVLRRGFSVEPG